MGRSRAALAAFFSNALALSFFGCRGRPVAAGDWGLVRFERASEPLQMFASSMSIDRADDGSLSAAGFSGVNDFRASFDSRGKSIKMKGSVASTRMAGPLEIMEFERAFLEFLEGADEMETQRREGRDTLLMRSSALGESAVFSRLSPVDSLWILDAMNDGGALVSVDGENPPTLLLGADGASAFTGLNRLLVKFKADSRSRSIRFDMAGGASTLASGSDEDMERESLFLRLISEVGSYSIDARSLSLFGDGERLLEFRRKDWM